jgi:hypothetical protein
MDEKQTELIQREIDGVNSERESAALREYLTQDSEAFELYTELAKMAQVLERTEEVDPPAELRSAILSRVESRGRSSHPPLAGRGFLGLRPTGFVVLRYAAVLAVGVLLGIVVAQLVPSSKFRLNTSDVSGTMAPQASVGTSKQLRLDGERLTGSVFLNESPPRVTLTFDLRAGDPVQLVVDFDGDQIGFAGFARATDDTVSLESARDRITLTGERDHRYDVQLERRSSSKTVLELKVFRSGALVSEGTFHLADGG